MKTNFEWYQILLIYGMGILNIVLIEKSIKDLSEYGIKRWQFGVIYVASGIIGMYMFGVEVDTKGKNLFIELWKLLKDSPIDFGINVIVMVIMYNLFALAPMVLMLAMLACWNAWKNGKFNNKNTGR